MAENCANRDIDECKAKISDLIISNNTIITFHTWWSCCRRTAYRRHPAGRDVDVTNRTIELPHVHKVELTSHRKQTMRIQSHADYRTRACSSVFLGNCQLLTLVSYIFAFRINRMYQHSMRCFVRFVIR